MKFLCFPNPTVSEEKRSISILFLTIIFRPFRLTINPEPNARVGNFNFMTVIVFLKVFDELGVSLQISGT